MNTLQPVNSFSIPRFIHQCKRIVKINQRTWLYGFAAGFGILFIIWLAPYLIASADVNLFQVIVAAAMFFYTLGGLAMTSDIFNELHSSNRAFRYLTLPSTTLEKFLSAWLLTGIGYTLVAMALFFLLGLLISALTFITGSSAESASQIIHVFNPFQEDFLSSIHTYFMYHSVFLLGAVYFKKNHFLSTLLAVILFFAFFGILSTLSVNLIVGIEEFAGWYERVIQSAGEYSLLVETVRTMFWIGIISLFLAFSYIRLKNKQIA